MALIIEDGSIVANANSYVTDLEFTEYAALRGFTLPSTAAEREYLLINAIDYLESKDYMGTRSTPADQVLSFPRYDVYANDYLIPSDSIPQGLKNAQMEAAIAYQTQQLLVNESVNDIQSEELDVLKVSYFEGGKKTRVRVSRVNAYLSPYLSPAMGLVRT